MYRNTYTIAIVAIVLVGIGLVIGIPLCVGVGGWGPTNTLNVTIERTYVDVSGSGDSKQSHYMVATDKGIFEIDNGWLLGIWNADELYGRLVPGKTYSITTKGNRRVSWWIQEYPYIVSYSQITKVEKE